MKKFIATTAFLCVFLNAFSQNEEPLSRSEIKLNVAYLIGGMPEVSYEYLINEESSVGASILYAIDNDIDFKFAFTPYYRFYFGKKRTAGFFVEGFGMLNVTEEHYAIYYYDVADPNSDVYYENNNNFEKNTNFALGIAVGGKFLTSSGFIFEIYGGIGRNLFNNNDYYNSDNYEFVPRFGVSVGKRF
ncbi:DUF3575 domain-containing protein [Lutibacter holmesii]|uniref:DUF3575 domain-containing protein n=1 Tax=Lutibacter holmesii TaxID=1137985 RepID=A0ABW3WR83_9FLAO